MRLAVIITHPIQYYAPVFKLLTQRQKLNIKVFYTIGENAGPRFDPGFNRNVEWDIPLLQGYVYEWVKNTSKDPGTHHFKGIINPTLIDAVQKWQPDALLVYGWSFSGHLKAMRHFKNRIPVLFRGDSTTLDEKTGLRSILRYLILKQVYHYIDHAFYVGSNNKLYFLKYGLKENQLSFAPHAVDNERFGAEKTEEASRLRKNLGIPENDILILFAGKLEIKKAPAELLKAVSTLNNSAVHLLFAGNGPIENDLKRQASEYKKVHFIDFQNQSQMPAVYQACDLFCLPSIGPGESWGLAVNEAMACKKPVLVSDKVGCAADLVINGKNGFVFQAGNLKNLIDSLRQLTKSKPDLVGLGHQSGLIIKDWDFLHISTAIEDKLMGNTFGQAKQQ